MARAHASVVDPGRFFSVVDTRKAERYERENSAGLTQLVECQLPKLDVAGSNPVPRSDLGLFWLWLFSLCGGRSRFR